MHGYYGSVEKGWLELITGVMFSGKSSELIRRVERAMIAKQQVLVFKPAIDNRYSQEEIATHNGKQIKAQIVNDTKEMKDIIKKKSPDVIAIDEGQFFSDSLIDFTEELVADGYRVIIAGLDTDFAGRGFAPIPELMARAEYISKLKAVCVKCSNPATRTQRIINGEPASIDDPIVVVGAEEKYEARCRFCHEVK